MSNTCRVFLYALLACAWPVAASFGQSPSPSSPQSQPAQQSSSQSQPQPQPQAPPQQKEDSVAEAARKAKAKKAAAAQGKVFTEDDLSGMRKDGVSVVGGSESKKTAQPARKPAPEGDYDPNSEQYWREKARPILEEIASVNQRTEQLNEEIKKYGNAGFDVTTGLQDSVAYVTDRNAKIEKLQKRKTVLEKQLDDLKEEGRKAGAEPAWFR